MIKDINELTFEELKELYLKDKKHHLEKINELQGKVDKLEKQHLDDKVNMSDLKLQLDVMNAKYMQAINAKYQSQRNQIVIDMPTLFDDAEEEALKTEKLENEEVITVGEYTKKKHKVKEKHIDYSSLEHKVETLPVNEDERACEICGSHMVVDHYEEKKELVYVPSEVYVKVTRIPVLKCENCESLNEEGKATYKVVSHPHKLFDRSMVSPSLLAYILDMKYNRGLPLYELEKMFSQMNVIVPRANMANWVIASMKYLKPLYTLMKEDLLSRKVVCADETRTQVLNEEGKLATSTSYMFVYRSIRGDGHHIILYDYEASRSGDHPKEFLKGYHGVLMTDAYSGYNKVEDITRCMCNIHALRKYKDSYKLLPNNASRKKSDEAIAIQKYDAIFHKENEIKEKAKKQGYQGKEYEDYIYKRRQKEVKPLFDEFLVWLKSIKDRNAGKYGMNNAINYTLNHEKELKEFLNYGYVPNSNQECEQAIRPFVNIRNRCKFYVSTKGAEVSAMIYSLVITAVENKVQPYMYFMYIFEKLKEMDLTDRKSLRELLPYSKSLPDYTKILSKKEIQKILKQNDME